MQPAGSEKESDHYTAQFVLCLLLVLSIAIGMAIYISQLNAWIDKRRAYSTPHSFECGRGQGVFIIDPNGKRRDCYFVEETEDAEDQ
ncbi:hypothetical protein C1Y08_22140 [Pseudomonas sp. FW306-02-F02-AA]|uniref:Transmembrane protein n=1 Tax=Pseudomonas fluorescens TaxID=294 RepID=A0A0N9VQE4_PSEFL|nr:MULTISPECIES: hypothetical protein [Pseudomonas]ALI02338.1 hypothetical protein AO353_15070 [Pseudomonas fluorescens]PMZ02621.1 hypothetical protein C1Y07_18480 [Pseudomonas sp. FW306-02-F02-AB]PMZ08334.1 hypothetical protein C1Y06_19355 [Pseudomonas sp. FW306-02-H06C]PMZ13687.1 hypothetical protein C1Y08_22140 [Pseudomonas sp. FW306-02-F02-AA]PMZ22778.1 hypothetical protein C1Y09_06790 [Pseudomonas sp. FW306-02-F08-AA]